MRQTYLAWLIATVILLTGLTACGGEPAPQEEVSQEVNCEQVAGMLAEKCAAISSWAATENVVVAFEANGNPVAKSEMTADVTVTPQAFSAVCRQAMNDGEQVTNLYCADGRVYVTADACRYTLELDAASVLHNFGIVPLSGLPSFNEAALRDKLTMSQTVDGYTLTCDISGANLKGEATELARRLLDGGEAEAEIAGLSVSAQVAADGTPRQMAFTVVQNTLSEENFFTIYTQVTVSFTGINDAVTLTPPEDLAAYDGAETAYRDIAAAMSGENATAEAYERLTSTYGQPLVDSVLHILGISAE